MNTQHELLDTAIKRVGNRYLATMLVAKRVRQLHHGAPAYVQREEGDSFFTVAMREVAEGHVVMEPEVATEPDAPEFPTARKEETPNEAPQPDTMPEDLPSA